MTRLTTKDSIMGRKHDLLRGCASVWKTKLKNYRYELIEEAVDKLGQLEDIEEELGIDLITLFKVMKSNDGIWVNGEYVPQLQFLLAAFKEPGQKIFRYPYSPEIGYFEDRETKEQHFGFKIYNYFVSIKDYGKTWALTKEELE